eukprot:4792782-Amphidinium_carterae.3
MTDYLCIGRNLVDCALAEVKPHHTKLPRTDITAQCVLQLFSAERGMVAAGCDKRRRIKTGFEVVLVGITEAKASTVPCSCTHPNLKLIALSACHFLVRSSTPSLTTTLRCIQDTRLSKQQSCIALKTQESKG